MANAKPGITIVLRPDGPAAKDITARLPGGAELAVGRCERTENRPGSSAGWRLVLWPQAGVPGEGAPWGGFTWHPRGTDLRKVIERSIADHGPWWTVPDEDAATAAGKGK
jgi:hypothetical protein